FLGIATSRSSNTQLVAAPNLTTQPRKVRQTARLVFARILTGTLLGARTAGRLVEEAWLALAIVRVSVVRAFVVRAFVVRAFVVGVSVGVGHGSALGDRTGHLEIGHSLKTGHSETGYLETGHSETGYSEKTTQKRTAKRATLPLKLPLKLLLNRHHEREPATKPGRFKDSREVVGL
ncbi:hypothetical protein, partial [Salinibacter ruber]|uniref:hypothetical protein n=1 Tax=Salinibacter ruber TaxID=146919 RepID=UPI002168525F